MIQFENVSKAFGSEILLENVSLKINKGEKCGLVGRNGSGKTTLFRMITGEESLDQGTISTPKHYSLSHLQQHLKFTEKSILEEACLALPSEYSDDLYKAEAILSGLGFSEEDMQRPPSDFSGGYQLRLHLTKALVSEPDCLLLDEPTNYLDVVSIRWLTRFLRNWKGEFLLISHDREFMDHVTTHTLGIHRHKLQKFSGGTEHFFEQILQQEEIHERTRKKLDKKRSHAEAFIKRFGAKATKASQAQSRQKSLNKLPALEKLVEIQNLRFSFKAVPFPGQLMLEAEKLSFSYDSSPSAEPLIDNFSLSIKKGDRIAIMGKNGRGKTTLLNLLAGELSPSSGNLKTSPNILLGYFGQTNIDRLNPKQTIENELAAASPNLPYGEIRNLCGVMMFDGDKAKKQISLLSGGERSRVLLGKILATPCNILFLDEPTNHLDMESTEALLDALLDFSGAVVLVTHNEMLLRKIPNQLVVCHQHSQRLFLGSYDDFLEKGGWEESNPSPSSTHPKSSPKEKLSKKELKKKKALILSERSHALRPLQKQIDQIEQELLKLESETTAENERLIDCSKKGHSEEISKLSKSLSLKQNSINSLYENLERLTEDYETIDASYQEKIDSLE